MGTKPKSKRSSRRLKVTQTSKSKVSQLNWPVILIAAAVLIGLFSSGRELFVKPSEAAVDPTTIARTQTTPGTLQRSKEAQGFIDEASDLFHKDYKACYDETNLAEKCSCMAGVVKKLEDLRARILATGKDYQDLITFWVDYYIKLIQQTLIALGCDVSGNVLQVKSPAPSSVWGRLSRVFRTF